MKKNHVFPILALMSISVSHAAMLYVDANYDGNTTNASGGSATDWTLDPGVTPDANAHGSDGLWGQRVTGPAGPLFGTNGWQIDSESGATLITTVTGLLPLTTYGDMRIYFAGKEATDVGNQWFIDASINGTDFATYGDDSTNSTAVNTANGGLGTAITAHATNDMRYYATLPNGTTDNNGNLQVWIRPGTGRSSRSVYDGIAFNNTPIPEPSAGILVAAALCVVAAKRRR